MVFGFGKKLDLDKDGKRDALMAALATITDDTPSSVHNWRTRWRNGVMGSFSLATSICMRRSRIMKFVADWSSSINMTRVPSSSASIMLAACEVDPLASLVEKFTVSLPNGRLSMNGEMFTEATPRPSSARIFTHVRSAITNSRPSPPMWL